ncbi:hypothetical protein DAA51_37720 [Bradyrhizobium sp. WBAH10]|nr:hypothetical protein [Bradyrhizobium sp. WBAH30]MDD1546356.1 hypothetical protein [Bradyrhizobium sp. WBAH41]MDD1560520.1 hypothetical protein [Bradyrhizobium sp. WBAH23]MDD1594025.1 hypothetical protein [Bradyrhizobium sp. WBAH42]NRB90847.1 hypothetical protein [Bradyrhizobium sp. WBAH10]QCJ93535.1 hypothetical protein DAA57_37740 [Bradyrhizobium yuanmingense]
MGAELASCRTHLCSRLIATMVDLKRASACRGPLRQAGGRGDRGSRPMDKALAIAWACILIVLVLFAALYLPWS